jgi:hypothetical protein
LKKPITKKGLVEWLKVKALSSNPSTTKKKKKKKSRVAMAVGGGMLLKFEAESRIASPAIPLALPGSWDGQKSRNKTWKD